MDAILSAAIGSAREIFIERLEILPPEDGRRLAALEGTVKGLACEFAGELWRLIDEELGRQAEAESGIRHLVRTRMDVAGAWDQDNAILLLALISIRASGWWNDFWRWRNQRDIQRWHQRQSAPHGRSKKKQEAAA